MGAPIEPVLEMMVPQKKQALKKATVAQAPGRAPEQSPDFLTEHHQVAAFLANSANSVDGWIAVEDVAQLFVRRDEKEIGEKLRFISIRKGMMLWQEDKANKGAISRGTIKGHPIMVAADRAWEVIKFVDERYAESPRSTYRLVNSEVTPKKSLKPPSSVWRQTSEDEIDDLELSGEEPSQVDVFAMYRQELFTRPLLTAQQKVEINHTIMSGTKEEKVQARQELVENNLRLVVKYAQQYAAFGIPIMDLIQEGNINLMKAAKRYDPAKGYEFSTMATWWIRHKIQRFVNNFRRSVRLPVYQAEVLKKYQRA